MSKIKSVLSIFIATIGLSTACSAEPYINKTFPPNDVLARNIGLVTVIGKSKIYEDVYTIFISDGMNVSTKKVYRLDSGLYILDSGDNTPLKIVQAASN